MIFSFLLTFTSSLCVHAQYEVKAMEGFSPEVGKMVWMLEDLRSRITEMTKDLSQEQTDFLFDENANSIGALVMHLASTEAYYQVETLEKRSWTTEEEDLWGIGGSLGDESRKKLKGKPMSYYLDLWEQIRKKSLEGLKTKDDEWLLESVDDGVNNYWAWYHVLEHSASHMGQIALIKNRLP